MQLTWQTVLAEEKQKEYFQNILKEVDRLRSAGDTIYPKNSEIFNSLKLTEFSQIKAVILGQDPYHGPGQAHGLCFSVNQGIPLPPSLLNIFKELNADLQIPISKQGDLTAWAKQGVLLLNSILTVKAATPLAHASLGWEVFTDFIIREISSKRENVTFLLWGSSAQKKALLIDEQKHLVLRAPHPSPLSAHRGFFGCKHFSKTNQYLKSKEISEIDWALQ